MIEQASLSRAEFTLKQRFEIVMTTLFEAFQALDPSNDRASFKERIIGPIQGQGDLGSGDRILAELMRLAHEGHDLKLDLCTMMIAFAYAHEAMLTLESDSERASSLMIDAYYWCGTLTGAGQISQLRRSQAFIECIGKKPVQNPGKMLKMKPRRCNTPGTLPK